MKYRLLTIPVVLAVLLLIGGIAVPSFAHSCCDAEIADLTQWWDDVDITLYIPDSYYGVYGPYSLVRFEDDDNDVVYVFKDRHFHEHEAREGSKGYHYFDIEDENVAPGRVTYVLESHCGTCDAESIDVNAFSMGCGAVNAGAGDTLIPALVLILLFILSLGSWKK